MLLVVAASNVGNWSVTTESVFILNPNTNSLGLCPEWFRSAFLALTAQARAISGSYFSYSNVFFIVSVTIKLWCCSEIERQNEKPATSGEPISLCHSKRQRVACCICRLNSRCKFGFIWLWRLTNARGRLCKPCGVNSIRGNTRRKEEERDEKWRVNLFLLSYFADGIGLYFWPLSFSVDFYLTSYFGVIRTKASRQFDVRLFPKFSSTAKDIPIME